MWWYRVNIVSALSLSLRDKEREREKREIELDNSVGLEGKSDRTIIVRDWSDFHCRIN